MANVTRSERDHENAHKAGRSYLRITVKGVVSEYVLGLTSVVDSVDLRTQTGLPLEAYLPQGEFTKNVFGIDSLAALWYLARKHSGEENLRWKHVAEQLQDVDIDKDVQVDMIDPDEPVEDAADPS